MSPDNQEVVELRRRIARLTEEARKNEEAWKRNQECEMRLLEAETLAALLSFLTEGLREVYDLDAAALFLVDPEHSIRHLLIDQGGQLQSLTSVNFVDALRAVAPLLSRIKKPWLGPYAAEQHAALFPVAVRLKSIALLPLPRHGTAIASLNLGSVDPKRFTARHATDFLEHLGAIAAYCLENTVNRARLLRTGFRDVLTGWHNRRYLQTRLEEEMARSMRDGTPLTALMVDIDHFKRINDSYGHLTGDEVLRQVARRIAGEVRASDVSARYGGEEFIVLLPATDSDAGYALAERVRSAVSRTPFGVPGPAAELRLTVSIGVAEHRPSQPLGAEPAAAGEKLIAAADLALYDAKAAGRNRVARLA
jgi:diguanylate cyclase (GGDEF)-like protein